MKHTILLFCLLLLLIPASGALGQSVDDIQQQFHRAETAWKNRSSLLEAKVRVDQVLEGAPDHADALKLRAEVLMAMRRYKEALVDAQKAIQLSPDDGAAFLVLAEAARLNGDTALARTSLENAGRHADRIELLANILQRLEHYYKVLNEETYSIFVEKYTRRLAYLNEKISLRRHESEAIRQGIIRGVSETGALQFETDKGIELLHAGEVTTSST